MRRREFIAGLGSAAAWPLAAGAQQAAMPAVGFLYSDSADATVQQVAWVRGGLAAAGYVEGQSVRIEYRWANNQYDRLPELAADLVQRRVVAIIAAGALNAAVAAKEATKDIPIVFLVGSDPVQIGLVASLNRPGGNITGVTLFNTELLAKRLELLRELVPNAATIGLLVNPNNPNTEPNVKELQALAQSGGWLLHVVAARDDSELDAAFAALKQWHADGFLWGTDQVLNNRPDRMAALAAKHAIPGIASNREFVESGGLISYGASRVDGYRQVGVYAGRILKGEKPADLPVMQPTRFETVLNLKTAKALGLTIRETLLATADEVIQ
jgi:putative tryptophan/tyrosine transport system substrate-binding protein